MNPRHHSSGRSVMPSALLLGIVALLLLAALRAPEHDTRAGILTGRRIGDAPAQDTPDPTETPALTATSGPGITPTSPPTGTPDGTPTPGETATPGGTTTPDGTMTPDATATPDQDTPTPTPSPTPVPNPIYMPILGSARHVSAPTTTRPWTI